MIEVFADNGALNAATAERIVAAAVRAVAERGGFHLVLSGGETPKPLYELLATPAWKSRIDWKRTHVYWSDERCVPVDDPRSNAGMTRRALLDHVPVPAARFIRCIWEEAPSRRRGTMRRCCGKAHQAVCPGSTWRCSGLARTGIRRRCFPARRRSPSGNGLSVNYTCRNRICTD